MKKIFTIITLAIFSHAFAASCDCLFAISFCETVTSDVDGSPSVAGIVHAVVNNKTEDSLDMVVVQTLYGEDVKGKHFYFLDSNTFSNEAFDIGEEYIFAVNAPLSEPQYFHYCYTYFLLIKDGKVKGNIADGIKEQSLKQFAKMTNCGFPQSLFDFNPTLMARNELTATPKNWFIPTNVELQMFNALGQIVYKNHLENYTGEKPITVEIQGLSAGVYFCQASFWGRRQTTKIVKVN